MIRPHVICNICHHQIQYHPCSGADCLSLNMAGPVGMEGSTLQTDDYREYPEHSSVHLCRTCEFSLENFFADRKKNTHNH